MNAITQSLVQIERELFRPESFKPNFTQMAKLIRRWSERAAQRRHLTTLTRWELDDVGISPEAAAAEAAKPFWRA